MTEEEEEQLAKLIMGIEDRMKELDGPDDTGRCL